ncbi:MAG: zinc-dependent alcohol dehydrogenase family protein [Phycisphaeraceae bacterium]|nr:zinc-dependent alcohol dehydrogenase family protein [Phycisphaeraceae bacterium]
MKAVVFESPEKLAVRDDVPDPVCGPDEVVVRVARVGICGTDLHIYRNEYMSTFPVVPGHEFCGRVVEVGREVRDLREGDRVAVDPNLSCNACYFCRMRMHNHCLNWRGVGITRGGAFAEFVAAPAAACYKLPDDVTDEQAALIEPLSCVVHALERLRVHPGDETLIYGAGPMGLMLTAALRRSGASAVVVVDKQERRLALAADFGASATVSADQPAEAIRQHAPHGYGVVIDATGVPAVIERAFDHLRPRGQYLQFGVAARQARVTVSPYDIFRHDWTILGSFALCYTFEQAIAWLRSGLLDAPKLVSDRGGLSDFPGLFDRFARGQTLKVHLTP